MRRLLRPAVAWLAFAVVLFALWGWRLVFLDQTLAPVAGRGGVAVDKGPLLQITTPAAKLLSRALKEGTIPLWDPYRGIGSAFMADPHNAAWSPFTWILIWNADSVGWDVMILARLLLLCVGSYALARRLDTGPLPAAVCAVSLLLTGHVVHLQHHFHLASLAFVPWFLLGLYELVEGSARKGFFLVSVSMPLMIFGGGLLDVVLVTLAGSLMLGARGIDWIASSERGSIDMGRMAWFLGAVLVATLLSSVFVLPYVELRGESVPPHRGRAGWTYATASYYLGTFLRQLLVFTENPKWFQGLLIQHAHLLVVPGFVVGGLAAILRKEVRGRWLLLGAVVFVLFQDLKTYDFFLFRWIESTPILKDVRYEKYNGTRNLLLYLVATVGYVQLLRTPDRRLRVAGWLSLIAASVFPFAYVGWFGDPQASWRWLRAAEYSALAFTALILLAGAWRLPRPVSDRHRKLLMVGVLVLAATQWSVDADLPLQERDSMVGRYIRPGDPLRELLEAADRKRVFVEGKYPSPREVSGAGYRDVRDFSVVHTHRFQQFYRHHVQKSLKDCRHPFRFCAQRLADIRVPLLDRLGVDQIVAKRRPPTPHWHLVARQRPYNLYEREVDLGPLHLTSGYLRWSDEEFLERVTREDPEALSPHVAFSAAQIPGVAEGESDPVFGTAKVIYESFNSISFRVDVPRASLVILRHQYFPGWKAFVNDEPAEIHRVDYFFRGVVVPEGRHVVRMLYRPRSIILGGSAALLGLLILLVVAIRRPVRLSARAPTPPPPR